jgi:hypothetical protein
MAGACIEFADITPEDIAIKEADVEAAKTAEDIFIKKFIKTEDVLHIYGTLKI